MGERGEQIDAVCGVLEMLPHVGAKSSALKLIDGKSA
jgi:hypothetical protein